MTLDMKPAIKQLVRSFALFIALTSTLACSMHVNADQGDQQDKQPLQMFFVSAVLQHVDDINRVKLFHAVQSAPSSAEAELSFVEMANRDFPDYLVVTTLTTPVTEIKAPTCERKSLPISI